MKSSTKWMTYMRSQGQFVHVTNGFLTATSVRFSASLFAFGFGFGFGFSIFFGTLATSTR